MKRSKFDLKLLYPGKIIVQLKLRHTCFKYNKKMKYGLYISPNNARKLKMHNATYQYIVIRYSNFTKDNPKPSTDHHKIEIELKYIFISTLYQISFGIINLYTLNQTKSIPQLGALTIL